jgi:hypothetical protein
MPVPASAASTSHVDLYDFTVALELPDHCRPARESALQTAMAEQIARVVRPSMSIEVGRGGAHGETVVARPDRHRDHVLLQPLAVANAGIATGRKEIDETLLGDHFEANVRIGCEERRNDFGQHQSRYADWYTEAQSARRPVAKSVHYVDRCLDLCQCRAEPLQQAHARLGRGDAAGGPIEQPYT